MLCELKKDVKHIVTDDIRGYLTEYQGKEEIKQGNDRQYPPYSLKLLLLVRGRGLHTEKSGKTHTQSKNRHEYQGDILR